MCDDNEECGNSVTAKALAQLLGPQVEGACTRFLTHIRGILPDFLAGVNEDELLVVFCAGRTEALRYMEHYTDRMQSVSDTMVALVLADYSTKKGIGADTLQANLQAFENARGATQ